MRGGLLLAGLVMLTLGVASAARSRSLAPTPSTDPAAGVEAHASMPAAVKSILRRACFDCHSDETRWPWYSSVPPSSWLLERHVNQGRAQMNFSEWAHYNTRDRGYLLDRACELATKRDMPLWQYRIAHREARLTDDEIAALCQWTRAESARLLSTHDAPTTNDLPTTNDRRPATNDGHDAPH